MASGRSSPGRGVLTRTSLAFDARRCSAYPEARQRPLEAGPGALAGALGGLGGQEEGVRMGGQPGGQAQLRVAVVGRGVEVVHPELEEDLQQLVGPLLPHAPQGGRPEDHATALVARPPEGCPLDHAADATPGGATPAGWGACALDAARPGGLG